MDPPTQGLTTLMRILKPLGATVQLLQHAEQCGKHGDWIKLKKLASTSCKSK